MARTQFEIRTLLLITAVVGCLLTFATQTGSWIYSLLLTVLLANVLSVAVALFVYVVLPILERRSVTGKHADIEKGS